MSLNKCWVRGQVSEVLAQKIRIISLLIKKVVPVVTPVENVEETTEEERGVVFFLDSSCGIRFKYFRARKYPSPVNFNIRIYGHPQHPVFLPSVRLHNCTLPRNRL